jgi:hypothetical protein
MYSKAVSVTGQELEDCWNGIHRILVIAMRGSLITTTNSMAKVLLCNIEVCSNKLKEHMKASFRMDRSMAMECTKHWMSPSMKVIMLMEWERVEEHFIKKTAVSYIVDRLRMVCLMERVGHQAQMASWLRVSGWMASKKVCWPVDCVDYGTEQLIMKYLNE